MIDIQIFGLNPCHSPPCQLKVQTKLSGNKNWQAPKSAFLGEKVLKKTCGIARGHITTVVVHFYVKHNLYFPPSIQMSAGPYNAHGTVYRTISSRSIIAGNNLALVEWGGGSLLMVNPLITPLHCSC